MLLLFVLFFLACAHSGPRVRHKSPVFSGPAVMPDLSFGTVSLSSMLDGGRRWALLHFYPAAFTFVCPTELLAFSDAADEFQNRNVSMAFVSVDTKHSLLAWAQQPRAEGGLGGKPFRVPLVSDVTRQIGNAFDVLIDDGSEDVGLALRATFLIDPMGVLRHASISDLPVGRSVEESLRLVSAFQVLRKKKRGCVNVLFCFKQKLQNSLPTPTLEKDVLQIGNHPRTCQLRQIRSRARNTSEQDGRNKNRSCVLLLLLLFFFFFVTK